MSLNVKEGEEGNGRGMTPECVNDEEAGRVRKSV
jgi:hypothetical protein